MKKIKQNIRIKTNEWVFLLVFTVLAILVRGYSYGQGDQVLHLSMLQKLNNPRLYPGDDIFPLIYSHKTLTYSIALFLSAFFSGNFFYPYLIIYGISIFIYNLGIYRLSLNLFNNKQVSLLSLLFFIMPIPIAGAAINTVEGLFLPRLAATALFIFCLTGLLNRKFITVFLWLGIIFLIHPLSAEIYLPLTLMIIFLTNSVKLFLKIIFPGLGIFILTSIWVLPNLWLRFSQEKIPMYVSSDWLKILQLRNTYAFPLLWPFKTYVFLLVILLPLLILMIRQPNILTVRNGKIIKYTLLISCAYLLIQILFTDIYPVSLVVTAQLSRIWIVPIIFSFLYMARYLSRWLPVFSINTSKLKLLILLCLLFFAFIRHSQWLKTPPVDWIDVQIWAKKHTSENCTFLVNFYSQGFRVFSQRPIVGEFKDGTLSFYSLDFARIWNEKRLFFIPKGEKYYIEKMDQIHNQYPFSFIVLTNKNTINKTLIYKNNNYSLYSWESLEDKCNLLSGA